MTVLADLDHYWGGDIGVSNTGDLAPSTSTVRSQQRVLRRLLTNPGEYIFQLDYGAGLPQWIGRTADIPAMRALVRGQMLLEPSVAPQPEPKVVIAEIPNQAGGGFAVDISYTDATTGQPVSLSFEVAQ